MKRRKNTGERILAVLLAVMMFAVYVPQAAFAGTARSSGTCGGSLTWTLDSDGVLTIRGTGPMQDFDSMELDRQEPWYDYKDSILAVVIESGVTSIGEDAFEHCHYVNSVTIPNTVKSIGNCAFLMNISLEEVTIPEGVTSIGEDAFAFCEKLSRAALPTTVRSIGACAFTEDPITEVVIPDGVEKICWSTFQDCVKLLSVTIPDSVTEIERRTFSGCTSLRAVTGGSRIVRTGADVFADTPWLEAQGDYVVLGSVLTAYNGSGSSAFVPDGITLIADGALGGHTELRSINIPDSVTEIADEAFAGCSSLKTVSLPKKMQTLGNRAFADCTGLTSATIPAGLQEADESFADCSSLREVTFADAMTTIPAGLFRQCTGLIEINFPKALETIGEEAFCGCAGLTEIMFPETLEKIGYRAFYNCSNLKRIYIPLSVTSIGYGAFSGCADGLEVYYAGNEQDFFHLDEASRDSMANGYAPYFNADGFSAGSVNEPDAGDYDRSGVNSVRKLTWVEICDMYDLLVDMPENQYRTQPSASVPGYHPSVLTDEAVNYYRSAINYYRAVAGVGRIALTDELNESAAWGSLVQMMNHTMSHYPDQPAGMSNEDYAKGYYAASNSNLFYSAPSNPIQAIPGMISDSDTYNAYDLGHRRWLLCPYISNMGVGVADNGDELYTAIRVIGDGTGDMYTPDYDFADYDFISWPASGSNLSETFTPDIIWSVSLNGHKYARPSYREVTVTLQSLLTGSEWVFTDESTQDDAGWFNVSNGGYGYMDTIVFQPNTWVGFSGDYIVTVSGLHLLDGSDATIQYKVTFKSYGEARNTDESDYNPFRDVSSSKYCYQPVLWAVNRGVTNGTGETTFEPDKICTRAQVVTFLWRAMGCPEPESSRSPFADVANTNSWYYDAVLWAAENGITTGMDASHFVPDSTVTRAQFVTFLWRAAGEDEPGSGANPFADVTDPDSWYYDAVLWAVENGITNGIDSTHFGPGNGCTRGQVVTFLYRHLAEI